MSSRWFVVLVILQIATLAVLVGNTMRTGSADATAEELEKLRVQITGSMNHQADLAVFLDSVRRDLQAMVDGKQVPEAPRGSRATADGTEQTSASTEATLHDVTFPRAYEALQQLKTVFLARKEEVANDETLLAPLNQEIKEARTSVMRRGVESLHWIGKEVSMEVFEPGRDGDFVEYLLAEVLPELSGANPEATFDIARNALLKATNENRVRVAAAKLLKAARPDHWAKDVLDVVKIGGTRERDISLRVNLMDLFVNEDHPQIPEICRAFVADPRHPMAIRSKAVSLLSSHDSPMVDPTLRKVLFEDHDPELRGNALAALFARLKDHRTSELTGLLNEVIETDESRMQSSVKQRAQMMLAQLDA